MSSATRYHRYRWCLVISHRWAMAASCLYVAPFSPRPLPRHPRSAPKTSVNGHSSTESALLVISSNERVGSTSTESLSSFRGGGGGGRLPLPTVSLRLFIHMNSSWSRRHRDEHALKPYAT